MDLPLDDLTEFWQGVLIANELQIQNDNKMVTDERTLIMKNRNYWSYGNNSAELKSQ